jgi:Protein of unknown function (DUF2971)
VKIYKYVIFDRIDVLRNGVVRFTQPSGLNDPFDLQPIVEDLLPERMWSSIGEDFDKKISSGAFASGLVNPLMREGTKNLSPDQLLKLDSDPEAQQRLNDSFFKISEMLTKKLAPKLQEPMFDLAREVSRDMAQQKPSVITNEFGVLSLTEKADNLLMWAHYADSHKGFVIEFDSEDAFFKFPKDLSRSDLRKVDYVERRKLKTLLPENESIQPDWFFFQKSQYWSYEKEWRLVRLLKNADKKIEVGGQEIHLFDLPPSCITGIVLGLNMNQQNKDELINLLHTELRYHHVKILQARVNYDEDRLDIEPLI